jgi:hypothetical protein
LGKRGENPPLCRNCNSQIARKYSNYSEQSLQIFPAREDFIFYRILMKESQNKSARIIFFAVFATIAITVGWVIGSQKLGQSFTQEEEGLSSASSAVEEVDYVHVNIGEDDQQYTIAFIEDEIAFELLQRLDEENSEFSFAYDEFDFGVCVTEINGLIADDTKEFWSFEVNGEASEVGVSDHIVQSDDTLSFTIEAFN